jgi:hypothetical protein
MCTPGMPTQKALSNRWFPFRIAHLMLTPSGRVAGKSVPQPRASIVAAARLRNLRTVVSDLGRTLVAGPHDYDVSGFVIASGCARRIQDSHVLSFGASRQTSNERKGIIQTYEEARESHDMR